MALKRGLVVATGSVVFGWVSFHLSHIQLIQT